MKIKETRSDRVFGVIIYVLVGLIVLTVLYPLIYVISCSFSSPLAVAGGKVVLLPKDVTLIGYKRVFQEKTIMTGYANTLLYTVVGTIINLVFTLPCGYALSKKSLPGRNIIMTYFMITMYFGGGMIPTFLLVKSLGLYNTRLVLVLLGAFSVYNCIICKTFFAGLPKELEEAAEIDGCSVYRTFFQIVLPVSQALMGVMVLYFAIGHWNAYFNALMYIQNDNYKPLQLVLRRLLVEAQTSADMMEGGASDEYANEQYQLAQLLKYAVIVVSSLPVMILYPFLQKYFVKGVMIGSVKG